MTNTLDLLNPEPLTPHPTTPNADAHTRLAAYIVPLNHSAPAPSTTALSSPSTDDTQPKPPRHPNNRRRTPVTLDHNKLTSDIIAALGLTTLKELQRHLVDSNILPAVRARSSLYATYDPTTVTDLARLRAYHRLRRNTSKRGGLIVGQLAYTDIIRLIGPNAHPHHHIAATVYMLIRQGTLIWRHTNHPDNSGLMHSVLIQSPDLYDFMLRDHQKQPTGVITTANHNPVTVTPRTYNLFCTPLALMTGDTVNDYKSLC